MYLPLILQQNRICKNRESRLLFNSSIINRTVFKIFEFFIPFIQVIYTVQGPKNMIKKIKKSLPTLERIIDLILSKVTVKIIREIAEEDDHQESESALNLPEVEECLNILQQALNDRFYEPFVLISKKIIKALSGLIDISEIELGSVSEIQNSDILDSQSQEESK